MPPRNSPTSPSGALATRTAVADAAYSALTTDRLIAYTSLSAARVVTLCAAAAYPTGARLMIVDESGACSAAKTITVTPNGSDRSTARRAYVVEAAYAGVELESNGANAWTILAPKPNLQSSLLGVGTAARSEQPAFGLRRQARFV